METKAKNYSIGININENAIGYAVVNDQKKVQRIKGEPAWGTHLFESGELNEERRKARTNRRRIDRVKQRVSLIDEIFLPEVTKIDPQFYIRKKESRLQDDDRTIVDTNHFFADPTYTDKDFLNEYPTIHHLIYALIMNPDKKFDIRLINIALDWLVAHRGHFYSNISAENVTKILKFDSIYEEFEDYFEANQLEMPWDAIDAEKLGKIIESQSGTNEKKLELKKFLYGGKMDDKEEYPISKKKLIDFLAGGKVKYSALFKKDIDPDADIDIQATMEMEEILPRLGDDAELVEIIAKMYDWAILSKMLTGCKYLSEAKIKIYETHHKDLEELKAFVRKNNPDKYDEVFKIGVKGINNYTAYSYNLKSVEDRGKLPTKASAEDFYEYLVKELKLKDYVEGKIEKSEADVEYVTAVLDRMNKGEYMPKQRTKENRVVPHQVYYAEYIKIIENVQKHYPFLENKDTEGFSNIEKLKSIYVYKIPYYVGPLRKDNSQFAWIERKAEGKIYPWNFDEKVDKDASEKAFIDRMTNNCTYLPGEDVLPKQSLLYSKFMVLNEINNIRINDKPISVAAKQGIYNDLFKTTLRVTPKRIKSYLTNKGFMKPGDEYSGTDNEIKSSLKPQCEFKTFLERNVLTENDVDKIVTRLTYTTDTERFKKWLKTEFPQLADDDFRKISRLKYKDFGRLSAKLLNEIKGADAETGEAGTIIYFLWNTNDNLQALLSSKYTFKDIIEAEVRGYYKENPKTFDQTLDDLQLSNKLKRRVIRAKEVIEDITMKGIGGAPKRIFVEMPMTQEEMKSRSVSRAKQIFDLYKKTKRPVEDLKESLIEMGDKANNILQSDKKYLYYTQLGRCMYCGKPISFAELETSVCNIDHIYPKSLIRDESITNKVLVHTNENKEKKNYMLDDNIRNRMKDMWQSLMKEGFISRGKYSRLMRSEGFTPSEKTEFVQRQLTENRQTLKAVIRALQLLYPQTEIVNVSTKIISDFREAFNLTPRVRIINDLHYAKDAYLCAIVGNVYHEKFTKHWVPVEEYTLNAKTIFERDLAFDGIEVWGGKKDVATVLKQYNKNQIHLTRYSVAKHGMFFKENPLKKGKGQIQLKKGLEIDKYGGYNSPALSYFVLTEYTKKGEKEVALTAITKIAAKSITDDPKSLLKAATESIKASENSNEISNVKVLLNGRKIKVGSKIEIDGFSYFICGKSNTTITVSIAESLLLDPDDIAYVKRLESYSSKKKINKFIVHDETNDKMSEQENKRLYAVIMSKVGNDSYKRTPACQYNTLKEGQPMFEKLAFDDQVDVLLNCINMLKTDRRGTVNLSKIGGSNSSCGLGINSSIKNLKCKNIFIVDESPSGIYVERSINLKELL